MGGRPLPGPPGMPPCMTAEPTVVVELLIVNSSYNVPLFCMESYSPSMDVPAAVPSEGKIRRKSRCDKSKG